jgi:hypothetical protein
MAKSVIKGKVFAWDGHRLSQNTTSLAGDFGRQFADATCYEDKCIVEVPGVYEREFVLEGLSTGDHDFALLQKHANTIATTGAFLVPRWNSVAHGQHVIAQNAKLKMVNTLGARGELSQLSPSFATEGDWHSGRMLYESVTGAATGSGTTTGTGLQLGAAPLGVWLCVQALDIPAITGTSPTASVKLQSDVDNTWASPTDVITNTSITTTADGILILNTDAATDEWWRVVIAVGGSSTPSYRFLIAAGVIGVI